MFTASDCWKYQNENKGIGCNFSWMSDRAHTEIGHSESNFLFKPFVHVCSHEMGYEIDNEVIMM